MQFYVVKTELFGKAPIPFYYDVCYLLATSAKNCPVFFKIKMPNYEINVHKIMIFQLVDAVLMDRPPQHVVQVVSVLANQILLEQSVHHVMLGITTIPIATVRYTV